VKNITTCTTGTAATPAAVASYPHGTRKGEATPTVNRSTNREATVDKEEEFENIVQETCEDLNDRMDNLEAIKGENFAKSVEAALSIYSVLKVATAHQIPALIRDDLVTHMLVDLTVEVCKALGLSHDELKEAMQFAKSMSETLETQGHRASQVLKS
jgi:hypothetical protein